MTPVDPVGGVLATAPALNQLGPVLAAPAPAPAPATSFGQVLQAGIDAVDGKLRTADSLVRRFALGDEIPMHQVTYALEEARLSVELAMQVRGRLLDGYRELMNMQL